MAEGETFVRSTLGTNVVGGRTTAPQYTFGTSTRDHREKLFVTEEHAKLNVKNKSPGPHADYHRRGSCGPQVDHNKSEPLWGWGSTTSARFEKPSNAKSPSPDAYTMRSAIGAQIDSGKDSTPIWGMGSSTRDSVKKVYLGDKQNAVTLFGMGSPGPAAYGINEKTCVGKQDVSCARARRRRRRAGARHYLSPAFRFCSRVTPLKPPSMLTHPHACKPSSCTPPALLRSSGPHLHTCDAHLRCTAALALLKHSATS
jgi:hypothetical protein